MTDKTCMSYWFPKIEAGSLPVPITIMLEMPSEAFRDIYRLFDGEGLEGDAEPFFAEVRKAAEGIGYPCFLRTGHTSGKHDWDRTCYVQSADDVANHIVSIVEYSEMAGIIGLPSKVWAVREFLPTKPLGLCPAFGNMPICREFRFFVEDSSVRCWHPYWPRHALEQGGADISNENYEAFCQLDDGDGLHEMALAAGAIVGGAWSVDFLETERGWYLIDMAEAEKSFHWEGCEAVVQGGEAE